MKLSIYKILTIVLTICSYYFLYKLLPPATKNEHYFMKIFVYLLMSVFNILMLYAVVGEKQMDNLFNKLFKYPLLLQTIHNFCKKEF